MEMNCSSHHKPLSTTGFVSKYMVAFGNDFCEDFIYLFKCSFIYLFREEAREYVPVGRGVERKNPKQTPCC